jgi:hypothetical protein
MVWISLFIALLDFSYAKELPRLLTKHSMDSIRFITGDGRYTYVEKRPGVMGLVSSFRSVDFLSEPSTTNFIMTGTSSQTRLALEAISFHHNDNNLMKMNKILVLDWGDTVTKEMGIGVNAKLHRQDEWISFYRPEDRTIIIKNVVTLKSYEIKLSFKISPFFWPEVEMVNSETVVYTDVNEKGIAALVQQNLITKKATVIYKSPLTATRLELCQAKDYLAVGEFPYEGVTRGSSISTIKLSGGVNLSGLSNIYKSVEQDIGNMVCLDKSIYFVKTMQQDKKTFSKLTEAVKLDLDSGKLEVKTELQAVAQLIHMDDRVLVPFRGDFFVLEGQSNLSTDVLKNAPGNSSEELPLDL